MFYQLMPLHWGLVNLNLQVRDVIPESRVLPPVESGDTNKGIAAQGVLEAIAGRGVVKKVIGSGIIKKVSGRGKLCP